VDVVASVVEVEETASVVEEDVGVDITRVAQKAVIPLHLHLHPHPLRRPHHLAMLSEYCQALRCLCHQGVVSRCGFGGPFVLPRRCEKQSLFSLSSFFGSCAGEE